MCFSPWRFCDWNMRWPERDFTKWGMSTLALHLGQPSWWGESFKLMVVGRWRWPLTDKWGRGGSGWRATGARPPQHVWPESTPSCLGLFSHCPKFSLPCASSPLCLQPQIHTLGLCRDPCRCTPACPPQGFGNLQWSCKVVRSLWRWIEEGLGGAANDLGDLRKWRSFCDFFMHSRPLGYLPQAESTYGLPVEELCFQTLLETPKLEA